MEETTAVLATCAENLNANLTAVNDSLAAISRLTDDLRLINLTFGSFVNGLLLSSQCLTFQEPLRPLKVEEPFDTAPAPAEAEAQINESVVTPEQPQEEKPPPSSPPVHSRPRKHNPAANKVRQSKAAQQRVHFPKDKIIQSLPAKYQQPPHRGRVETILDALKQAPVSLAQSELCDQCGLTKHQCLEYVNVLSKASHVLVDTHKGMHCRLHPKHIK